MSERLAFVTLYGVLIAYTSIVLSFLSFHIAELGESMNSDVICSAGADSSYTPSLSYR